ncbi:MAG: methylmalonyl-CoA epimerase [Rhodospirillaceae bacterium]|nr:methylmalonyl-CoA epimerase [Rhodospirillaceae bacterium]
MDLRLNHVAIAVPDLNAAAALYRDALGAEVSGQMDLAEHGVSVIFVQLPNTKIELIHPFGEKSSIAGFLEKNPNGGIHHICLETSDVVKAAEDMVKAGKRVLGPPKIGAHNHPVIFLHPKDFNGALVELEEVKD